MDYIHGYNDGYVDCGCFNWPKVFANKPKLYQPASGIKDCEAMFTNQSDIYGSLMQARECELGLDLLVHIRIRWTAR